MRKVSATLSQEGYELRQFVEALRGFLGLAPLYGDGSEHHRKGLALDQDIRRFYRVPHDTMSGMVGRRGSDA